MKKLEDQKVSKVLKVFVAKWLRDKLKDLFRETGDIAKIIGVTSNEVKLTTFLALRDVIEVGIKIIEKEEAKN